MGRTLLFQRQVCRLAKRDGSSQNQGASGCICRRFLAASWTAPIKIRLYILQTPCRWLKSFLGFCISLFSFPNHTTAISTLQAPFTMSNSNDVFDVEAASLQQDTHKPIHRGIPSGPRNALVVLIGEFCGTFMFLLLSFIGAQTAINNNDPKNNDPDVPLLPMSLLYIACAFGTALAANVWIFFRVSGGMFNPAVSARQAPPPPQTTNRIRLHLPSS